MRLGVFGALLALSITSALEAQTPAQQPLNLTCVGGGTASKPTYADIEGDGGSATITSRHDQHIDDQTDIRLFNGDDRIRLPRTMLPPLHGGSDGWFKLKNDNADVRTIRANAAVNLMNNPKVYIDRVTGTISISGRAGDYSGQCEAIDPNAPTKF